MAIKTLAPQPSKKTLMRFMVLMLLSWFVLMAWAFSLWCYSGFDLALSTVTTLLQKQTHGIAV